MLEGHIVLIGSSAQGLMDLRFSPFGRLMPGVEAHAQAIEQILSDQVLIRPSWAPSAEIIAIVIGGLAISLLAIRVNALIAAGTTLIFLVMVFVGGWYAFRNYGLLLNTVTPALIFGLAFVLGSLIHHFISEREQRWIKEVFSRYVSPNRVSYLVDHPDAMELGGSRQECSFIFTDLADFTALMESIDPGEAVAMLNAYLDQMIGIAFRFDGTLDRIVGDSVAIMFSAPVPQSDHRARALACALEMDAFASGYSEARKAKGICLGKTRIGIHTGEVIVGNFGGSTIFDYRALGDPVNTASRLESVNKQLGTTICISEATLSGCPDSSVRPVGRLLLKGKSQALQVFEPVTASREHCYAPIDRYMAAYRLMTDQTSAEALTAFSELAASFPDDPLVVLHHRRFVEGAQSDLIIMAKK
jgi:adenylate cyclase